MKGNKNVLEWNEGRMDADCGRVGNIVHRDILHQFEGNILIKDTEC